MKKFVSHFLGAESGTTVIEYGLIAALISVVCIGAMTFIGTPLLIGISNISAVALMGALG
jgi:pilus assembly protein Flp/PilA